jgi:hypothetical protein
MKLKQQGKVNMKIIRILTICFTGVVFISHAEEVKPNTDTVSKTGQKTLTIESKVTGSQEQPKVLYIMPWQGIANPIIINDKKTQLAMPEFKPINPRFFKKEVREFAAEQASKAPVKSTKKN